MKNRILFFVLLFVTVSSFAKFNVKIYYEKSQNGYVVMVDNNEFCPVSVKIKFELSNLRSSKGNNKVFVIPANSKNYVITNLVIINSKASHKFKYNTTTNIGNDLLNKVPKDFNYNLPFKKNEEYTIHQGYKGNLTHKGINALDFSMPIGTQILAVRSGIVIMVVQSNDRSCIQKNCAKFNNRILIYHEDGTFANYAHIKKNGSKVKVGDKVKQGQLIGLSGNVGRTSGPHLHLEIFLQQIDKKITLKTKFLTEEGNKSQFLKEKETYLRKY